MAPQQEQPTTSAPQSPQLAPMQAAVMSRATRIMQRFVTEASDEELQVVASEPSDYAVLLATLESNTGNGLLIHDDIYAEARRRGLRMKESLGKREGGLIDADEAASLIGLTRQAIHQRAKKRKLIAVETGPRKLAYPAWQFVAGKVLEGIPEVLAELRETIGPWMTIAFFLDESEVIGRSPLEALRAGDLADAISAAKELSEMG